MTGENVLIILIAGIGDLVLASKAMRAVRNGYPHAQIHLLTSSDAAPLARNYPYLDRVWTFPIRELRRNKAHVLGVLELIGRLRRYRFSLVVNLYRVESAAGALKMGLLFQSIRAGEKVGHDRKGFGLFLTRKIPPAAFHNRHIAEAMHEMALSAGGIDDGKGIEVFWADRCEETWEGILPHEKQRPDCPVIGVNPGGDRPNRRWNPDRYAVVADRLIENHNARVVLLGAPSEKGIARRITERMRNSAETLTGRLTLNELAHVIGRLDLLITNDSGPMHIAAALDVPLVAVFGPEDPVRHGPFMDAGRYRIVRRAVSCHPCTKSECEHLSCLESIDPGEVYEAAVSLLARTGSKTSANPSRRHGRRESVQGMNEACAESAEP